MDSVTAYRQAFDAGFRAGWEHRQDGRIQEPFPLSLLGERQRQALAGTFDSATLADIETFRLIYLAYEEGYRAAYGAQTRDKPEGQPYEVDLLLRLQVYGFNPTEAQEKAKLLAEILSPTALKAQAIKEVTS